MYVRYSKAYVDFLVYFQGVRDYFECHEILEDEWKKVPREERHSYWKGFIAVAVSQYHYRRGNLKGAERAMQNAITRFENEQSLLRSFGLDGEAALQLFSENLAAIRAKKPYESMNLPIIDTALIKRCRQLSQEKGCSFGNSSDMSDEALINKHRMPNRDAVISKRETIYRRKKEDLEGAADKHDDWRKG